MPRSAHTREVGRLPECVASWFASIQPCIPKGTCTEQDFSDTHVRYCYSDGRSNEATQSGLILRATVRSASGSTCTSYTEEFASDMSSATYSFGSPCGATLSLKLADVYTLICDGESTVVDSANCPDLNAILATLDQYFLEPSEYECGYGTCP